MKLHAIQTGCVRISRAERMPQEARTRLCTDARNPLDGEDGKIESGVLSAGSKERLQLGRASNVSRYNDRSP